MDRSTRASTVTILASGNPKEVGIFSLVLSAAHIPHSVAYNSESSWEIAVSKRDAERARYEIAAIQTRNEAGRSRDRQPMNFSPPSA